MVLFVDLMIVRQVCFLFTRGGVTQGNALFGRFWEQAFRQTVIYVRRKFRIQKSDNIGKMKSREEKSRREEEKELEENRYGCTRF